MATTASTNEEYDERQMEHKPRRRPPVSGAAPRCGRGDRSTMMKAATVYQIRVSGHLDSQWNEWFGNLEIDNQPNGEATLTGAVVDQAALHGLLQQLFALNITLLAVNRLEKVAPV